MPNVNIIQIYNLINTLLKYTKSFNFSNNEIALNLRLQNVKKYYKCTV